MVQDTMEAMDDDELEEEAEEEVNKVLFQITDGRKAQRIRRMGGQFQVSHSDLFSFFFANQPFYLYVGLLGEAPVAAGTLPTEEEAEEEPALDDMQRRLEALKS